MYLHFTRLLRLCFRRDLHFTTLPELIFEFTSAMPLYIRFVPAIFTAGRRREDCRQYYHLAAPFIFRRLVACAFGFSGSICSLHHASFFRIILGWRNGFMCYCFPPRSMRLFRYYYFYYRYCFFLLIVHTFDVIYQKIYSKNAERCSFVPFCYEGFTEDCFNKHHY